MSFQTGLSGLNASSRSLDVIGNNIANANTVGAKASRAEFAGLVAANLGTGGGGGSGIGVGVETVSQLFTQGSVSITGNNLDLAISGGGFFQVTLPNGNAAYTRAGQFKLDSSGNIVTNGGAKVMGYPTDTTGVATSTTPQPMQLPTSAPIPAKATDNISVEFNLKANAPAAAGDAAATPPILPTPRSTYGTSLTAYDSQGTPVPINIYFEKATKATPTDPDIWNVFTDLDPAAAAIGSMTFGSNGKLVASTNAADGAGTASTVVGEIDVPGLLTSPNLSIVPTDIKLNLANATQFGSNFSVTDLTQSGYANGSFTGLTISETGVITASYSNGQTLAEGMLALANFRNPQGLEPIGGNNWAETFTSGAPINGSPGNGQFGALRAGALEDSNVDLTAELVNMMTAQRAYQANAQTIKTQDQVMSTLVNLR
ncbi:MAG: hypothetical protein RJA34_2013 [Pseudomonadota bacterium]